MAPIKGLVGFLLELPQSILRWCKFLHENKTRIINVHYPTLDSSILLLLRWSRLFRGKIILSLHGTDLENAGNSQKLERRVWSFIFATADSIVVCSSNLGQRFTAYFPRYAKKLTTIHNGVSIESLHHDRDMSFQLAPRLRSSPFILCVGTFAPVKGHDVLVQAFSEVVKKIADLHLVIVGRAGPAQFEVEQLIENLGLGGRVTLFTDVPHDRIAAFLQRARLFVLPSRSEAFGIVLLEAAAFSLPVIASNVGGTPEIVEHGVSGQLVEPEDVTQLASEIIRLIDDKEECARLGSALNAKVLNGFRWADAYTKYVQLAK